MPAQWVSMTDFVLEYHSPVMLLNEALAEAAALNYGTDSDNALQTAVSEAQGMLAEGTASERVAAYESLLKAINQYKIKNASAEHPVDMTEYVKNGDSASARWAGWTSATSAVAAFCQGAMEVYHAPFDFSQTVSGRPIGNYRFSMQARSNSGADNSTFGIYLKNASGEPTMVYAADKTRADGTNAGLHLGQNADDFKADAEVSRIAAETFSTGEVTVGMSCTSANMWCVLGGLRLEYTGV